jgi:hypothetical protein
LIPVALKTLDVGHEAFYSMIYSGRLKVVPTGADKVLESIYGLIMLSSIGTSVVIYMVWGICDPGIPHLDPNNDYDLCLLRLVQDFLEEEFIGTIDDRFDFMNNDAHLA